MEVGRAGSSSLSIYAEVREVAGISGSCDCGLSKLERNLNVSQLDGLDGMAEPVPELAEGLEGNAGIV